MAGVANAAPGTLGFPGCACEPVGHERTATTLISKLLDAGLLRSDSPRGLVRFRYSHGCTAVPFSQPLARGSG